MVAGLLATFTGATIAKDPPAELRLGLEAHVLYALGSEAQLPAMRYQMGEHGPPWAQVLLACSQLCDRHGQAPLALDLAAWMAGVVNQLMPFAIIDAAVRSTMVECVSWHVELLQRNGDLSGASDARQALEQVQQMG